MSPLISVLMPVLNEERSVVQAVRSVLDQQGVDVEVLVIDGNSADRTIELVSELVSADPRVRLLHNPDTVIPAGLNIGLQNSRGSYVARVDGHASISPDYLARAMRWLTTEPKMGSVGGLRIGVGSTAVGRAIALVLSSPFGIGNSINHFAKEPQLTDHASFGVFRADAARAVEGWDESLLVNEDVDFDHRLQEHGYLIGFDPEMKVYWQVRESVPALFRQYRRYGRGKGLMIRKNGLRAIRLRHAVPPLAVIGGSVLVLTGLWNPLLWLLLSPYVLAVLLASLQAGRKRKDRSTAISWAALPAGFVATHAAWGLGFIEGGLLRRQPMIASGSSAVTAPATAS